ncbi:FAD-dependent oxidoreductase [Pseudomonas sp.]|uniref:FAD-dependent oxidoreductase n=1 Tax=Pseudomonas sp. TaxID=306 RepID=UPI003CC66EAC
MNASKFYDCDVLVIGSGASGLAAAVTAAHHGLKVIVAEKHHQLGGTSAWSGGWLWVPGNPLAVADGQVETPGAVENYLRHELLTPVLDERLQTYLQQAPQMVDFFQQHTQVQFYSGSHMPDMHASPGAATGGRSLCAQPFDGRQLGNWLNKLRPPLDLISLGGMGIAGGADLAHFFNATRSPRSAFYVAGRLLRHWRDRLLQGRGLHLVNGNALVARLLRSALDLNVELRVGTPALALLREGQRVVGAKLSTGALRARCGVVLAAGGFAHDPARMAALSHHDNYLSAAPAENTGDGLRLGEQMGAVMPALAHCAAWAPVSKVQGSAFPHLMDRAKPGFIAVRDDGKRFTNEADSYHDFMQALFAAAAGDRQPHCWLICDHKAQRRYGLGAARPFPLPTWRLRRQGYLMKGRTLSELAERCGINANQLKRTVDHFNAGARHGRDDEFQRGESAYNRAQGEALHNPNPSLGELRKGPFYAVKLEPGSLGTFSGLATDCHARVLDANAEVIEGLHAVGNDMSSIMGGHYPSGGITLGPALTFGYLAGLSLAEQPIRAAGNAAPFPRSSRDDAPCALPH